MLQQQIIGCLAGWLAGWLTGWLAAMYPSKTHKLASSFSACNLLPSLCSPLLNSPYHKHSCVSCCSSTGWCTGAPPVTPWHAASSHCVSPSSMAACKWGVSGRVWGILLSRCQGALLSLRRQSVVCICFGVCRPTALNRDVDSVRGVSCLLDTKLSVNTGACWLTFPPPVFFCVCLCAWGLRTLTGTTRRGSCPSRMRPWATFRM